MRRFNNRDDTLEWAASVSLSPQEVQVVKDQSIREIVSKSVRTQVFNALRNFNDISMKFKSFLSLVSSNCQLLLFNVAYVTVNWPQI